MQAAGRRGRWHVFVAEIARDDGNVVTRYSFKVVYDGTQSWLAADGPHRNPPAEAMQFRINPHDRPPRWVRDQVFYQVFIDRFARGQPPEDRSGEMVYGSRTQPVKQLPWGAPLDPQHAATTFYGGDLAGIESRLDHLQRELGITALYLTPVFTSGSNHKYDCEDFDHVDPHLGGDAALASLCAALRGRGMRVMLDAVLNHTGTNHPWFNRWSQHPTIGAAQSADSPFRNWYAFDAKGEPLGWNGHASLPILDYRAEGLRQAIYEAPDSVVRRWLRPPYAIDGWRLDAVHMLGEGAGSANNAHYLRAFRVAIKETRADAYVLGEHFAEATRWLQGDQEDGAMNYYGFAQPLRSWLAGTDVAFHPHVMATADFERWIMHAIAGISWDNQLAQMNLLGSHDTPRLLTLLHGDAEKMKLAATLLFTWPGVPCIYYGDEIGMEGTSDPDCRRCFPWDRAAWNLPLYEHFRRLIKLRKTRAEWRDGAFALLGHGEDWFAFARYTADAASIVVANRGDSCDVALDLSKLPVTFVRWQTADGSASRGTGATLELRLPASSAELQLSSGPPV
jgi:alpha-glucosidase